MGITIDTMSSSPYLSLHLCHVDAADDGIVAIGGHRIDFDQHDHLISPL